MVDVSIFSVGWLQVIDSICTTTLEANTEYSSGYLTQCMWALDESRSKTVTKQGRRLSVFWTFYQIDLHDDYLCEDDCWSQRSQVHRSVITHGILLSELLIMDAKSLDPCRYWRFEC